MKALLPLALIVVAPFAGCGTNDDEENTLQALNVNSRYTVESVHVMGLHRVKISDPLRSELDKVIGSKYDDSVLKKLADRIRREVSASEVKINAVRGNDPDHLVVNFE